MKTEINSKTARRKKSVVVAAVAASLTFLAACSSSSSSTAATDSAAPAALQGQGQTIALSLNGVVDYTKYVAQGFLKGLEGTGYDVKIVQANFDVQTELKNLEGLISQGVAGIVVQPNTIDTVLTAAKQAKAANIPTSLALWAAPGPLDEYMKGVSALDSVSGGKMIGEYLKANAKPGEIIVVQGVVGQGFSEKIDEGLDAALKGTGFKVVVREQGFFDRNKAIDIVAAGMQAHPNVTAIVDYAATMGDGISNWLKQQGKTNITHVTSDGDEEMLTWMGTPYLAASRYYSAADTGLLAAKALVDSLGGKTPTFKNDIFQTMMTADNKDATLAAHPLNYPDLAGKTGL